MTLRSFLFRSVALALSAVGVVATASETPNIVVIVADDLGSHDVGWRGSEIKTPNLDALALGGARLEQFYVQPVCSPTRGALLTGRYPFRYGFQTGVVRPWAKYGLPLEERTLAQALGEAGYETAIVGKWHLGHFAPEYLPTRRGFDHQYGHYNGALDYYTHIRDGGFDWHRDDQVNRDEGYSTELIGNEAARLIRERDESRKLFLYVPFNGVHSPHQVPKQYEDAYPQFTGKRKTYAGMVTALDDAVGKIVETLRAEGLSDQTLVVFTSDNGGPNPGVVTSNGDLRAGKGTIYEGGVRTCAFATWPGHIEAGTQVKAPIHVTDLYPTLIGVAGGSIEQALPVDGRDVWSSIADGKPSSRSEIVINTTPIGGAIRVGDWKLVVGETTSDEESDAAPSTAKGRKRFELYDLAADPSESKNVAQANPDKAKELLDRYESFAAHAVPPKSGPKPAGFQSPQVWGEGVAASR